MKVANTSAFKDETLAAWKKALRHKQEAHASFEAWLKERGVEGKVVTL